jgi:hypothetical protein
MGLGTCLPDKGTRGWRGLTGGGGRADKLLGMSIKDRVAAGGAEEIVSPGVMAPVGSRIGVHFHTADWVANFFQGKCPGLRSCRGAQVKIRLHQKNDSMGQGRKA